MNLLIKLYIRIKKIPYGTQMIEYDFRKFIIKKHDRTDYKIDRDYIKNINYIKKYGNIIKPVIVSKNDFCKRYVIRDNIMGYYAMVDSHIKNIPIKIT